MKLFLSCTCYWEWGLVWVIWPTSSWTKLFASPTCWSCTFKHRCVSNKLFTRLPEKPAGLLMGGPETWERMETVLQHNAERSSRCRKLCVSGLPVEELKGGGEHMGCVANTRSSQAASGNLKGWDQPQKLLLVSSVEVQVYGKSNFQPQ